MPFLPQPSPFTRARDRHQETLECAPDGWLIEMKMREGRLRWHEHVMRKDQKYVKKRMMEMELPGKRKRGKLKRRFLDVVKEDMGEVGATEKDIETRTLWRNIIRSGYS